MIGENGQHVMKNVHQRKVTCLLLQEQGSFFEITTFKTVSSCCLHLYHNRFRHIVQKPTKDGLPCPDNLEEVGNCIYCSDNATMNKESPVKDDCIRPCASKKY